MNTNDINVIREAMEQAQKLAYIANHPTDFTYAQAAGQAKHVNECSTQAIAALARLEAQQPRVRYRSQVSGMWYETLEAAGDVDCVEVDGVQFCQENGVKCLTQQQPKRLTDEEIERLRDEGEYMGEELAGFLSGLRYARDNGYLGGLSVEDAMDVLEDAVNDMDDLRLGKREHMSLNDYRTRLTAKLNGTLS
jgi:hypothetical protein